MADVERVGVEEAKDIGAKEVVLGWMQLSYPLPWFLSLLSWLTNIGQVKLKTHVFEVESRGGGDELDCH